MMNSNIKYMPALYSLEVETFGSVINHHMAFWKCKVQSERVYEVQDVYIESTCRFKYDENGIWMFWWSNRKEFLISADCVKCVIFLCKE